MATKLNETAMLNELREGSAFFRDARKAAQSPTNTKTPLTPKPKQPSKLMNLQTNRVTDLQSDRLTDFSDYEVPDYRKLKRTEMRLTWDQDDYLNQLESKIARDMPEGERSDPRYKRITKNSIIRALVEYARRLDIQVNASKFRNEADLTEAIAKAIESKLNDLQTNRVTESVSDGVTD